MTKIGNLPAVVSREAEPLGLQVGGPAMRLPDEYGT